ncbi:MAG: dipicolinate synthase [Oscillospiraceae bacterium]|nr:dipicolinate synthase [Oscillospiraceae bacterium]
MSRRTQNHNIYTASIQYRYKAQDCRILAPYFNGIIANATPTAEGAIEIALHELPVTIFGSSCIIIGYGRIAKVLARLLIAFGAKVRVAARSHSDLAWAKINGCEAVSINELSHYLCDVDCLFNTVPVTILGEEKLSILPRRCLVIDLASKPGGVDFEIAKTLGIKTIWALSLPGKVAPYTAGEIILSTIMNILTERGIA